MRANHFIIVVLESRRFEFSVVWFNLRRFTAIILSVAIEAQRRGPGPSRGSTPLRVPADTVPVHPHSSHPRSCRGSRCRLGRSRRSPRARRHARRPEASPCGNASAFAGPRTGGRTDGRAAIPWISTSRFAFRTRTPKSLRHGFRPFPPSNPGKLVLPRF